MKKPFKTRKYKGGNKLKLCFIIACKVFKESKIYIDIVITNINLFYPDSTIILVDNNSNYKEYFDQFKSMKNVIILENTSDSKFELGAYNFAISYIIDKKLKFNYYTLLQDVMIPIQKYDYTILKKNKIKAVSIYKFTSEHLGTHNYTDFLIKIKLHDPKLPFEGCFGCSFICNHASLIQIHKWTKDYILTVKGHSETAERFLGRIIQYLNNNIDNHNIDGYHDNIKYSININTDNRIPHIDSVKKLGYYFMKISQGRPS